MQEKLKRELLNGLSDLMTNDQLQKSEIMISFILTKYDVTASLAEVQMVLGHESPATTQIYAKLDLQGLQAMHQRCII